MRKVLIFLFASTLLLVTTAGVFACQSPKSLQTKYGKITIISGDPRVIIAPDPIKDGFSLYAGLPRYGKIFLGDPYKGLPIAPDPIKN